MIDMEALALASISISWIIVSRFSAQKERTSLSSHPILLHLKPILRLLILLPHFCINTFFMFLFISGLGHEASSHASHHQSAPLASSQPTGRGLVLQMSRPNCYPSEL